MASPRNQAPNPSIERWTKGRFAPFGPPLMSNVRQHMNQSDTPIEVEVSEPDVSHFYASYTEYNKVLRTWFVAFGIGGPAYFMVNPSVAKELSVRHQLRLVVALFLIGAASQVVGAVINKAANWYVYVAYTEDGKLGTRKHKCAEWVAKQFWFDILLDVLSVGVFGYAAWLLLTIFAA
jgi:hypothetical protein